MTKRQKKKKGVGRQRQEEANVLRSSKTSGGNGKRTCINKKNTERSSDRKTKTNLLARKKRPGQRARDRGGAIRIIAKEELSISHKKTKWIVKYI